MALILGTRGQIFNIEKTIASITDVAQKHNVEIQVFDASKIHGHEHLEIAAEKAERAFSEKRNLSNTLATEILLYAAAERQISQAIMKLGIKEGIDKLAVVVFGDADGSELLAELGWQKDDDAIGPASAEDLDAIIEKMAMSELER